MNLCILQARTSSRRLPGKVLEPILGEPMLARQLERLSRARHIDAIVVATSDEFADDPIAELAAGLGVPCYRGSLPDVLSRFIGAAESQSVSYGHDTIVRATGDCPLCDHRVIDEVIEAHFDGNADYTSNALERTYPDGFDIEVMRAKVLLKAANDAATPAEREHVTPYVYGNPELFQIQRYTHEPDSSHLRLTVDEPEDLALVRTIYERLYPTDPDFGLDAILALAEAEPELFEMNKP